MPERKRKSRTLSNRRKEKKTKDLLRVPSGARRGSIPVLRGGAEESGDPWPDRGRSLDPTTGRVGRLSRAVSWGGRLSRAVLPRDGSGEPSYRGRSLLLLLGLRRF